MDKDQLTGLVLLLLLVFVYFFFLAPEPQPPAVSTTQQDSVQAISSTNPQKENVVADSLLEVRYDIFATGLKGESQTYTLENEDIIVTFNTQGGKIQSVVLKNYVTYEKKKLLLFDTDFSRINETIKYNGTEINLNQLYYQAQINSNQIEFFITKNEKTFRKIYILPPKGFVLKYRYELNDIKFEQPLQFNWSTEVKKLEKDLEQERIRTTLNYYLADGTFDYLNETTTDAETETPSQPVRWATFKQKFFNTSILSEKSFEQARFQINHFIPRPLHVKSMEMSFQIPISVLTDTSAQLRYYFGPNDYDICQTVAEGFERNVYLGWAFFSTINLYVIIPIFKILEKITSNYGLVIFLLVLIVKILLFPLTYKSLKSMAKMRVLQPEINALKEKYGEDTMKIQQEMMKIYQQVGVNPLSGCIPVLAQMPVFLALFNFFPNAIQLRQREFLWADDLSSYDSILNLPFTIPMYGDHVSLFTILMTLTTILYTYTNNQMSAASMQPQMVVVSYVMPVVFMLFLNSFSAGLTYYYFISNIITIVQQWIIRKFFIDEEKIKAVLEENRKKNQAKAASGKKGRFASMLEEAMKKAQQQEEQKRKKS
ncbi:MAG: membrane protein insertase YidC [Cytophagales bacterium]|nr:membrane protein insertase YidC [Cytophagales bacterium]MDW8383870.1 membrane protein insertase YidC [Flammeovirgaceae bacterium]